MKQFTIISLALILGFVSGLTAAVKLFALDIDILAMPYANTAIVLDKEMHIQQGDVKLTIPAGAVIEHKYTIKSVPIYSLPIVGNLGDKPIEITNPKWKSFYADSAND